jgi:hypothetical protein
LARQGIGLGPADAQEQGRFLDGQQVRQTRSR